MAYDESLERRISSFLDARDDVVRRKMFGGVAFMVRGNLCAGVIDDMLMARVGPAKYDSALDQPFAARMTFTGSAMKGMVYVLPGGTATDEQLHYWMKACLDFVLSLPMKGESVI